MKNLLAPILFFVLASAGQAGGARAQEERIFSAEIVDQQHIQQGISRFDLIKHGELQGDWYLEGSMNDGVYRVVDGTTMYPDVRESGVWTMSANNFAPLTLSVDGDFSRNILDAELTWSAGRIKGEYRLRRPDESARRTVEFDEVAPAGAIFRAAAFALAPGIDFAAGPVSLTWFSVLSGHHEEIRLVPEGFADIETPTGEFQTQLIGVRGGSVENLLYITLNENPRLVRVDVVGQDMRMEYRGAE